MTLEGEKRLVAGYEEVSVSGFGERQQIVVVGVRRQSQHWKSFDDDGQVAKAVDQASGKGRRKAGADFWIARDTGDFVELLGCSEEVESAGAPEGKDLCRWGGGRHQGTKKHVGVDYQAHRYFRERRLRLFRLSLRTPATASAIMLSSSSAGTSAKCLRTLVTV